MKRALPTFYYHAHFLEMLDFLAEQYAHALLTEHVDEDILRSHHRALCDAEAAAELLMLVNEKRFEGFDCQRRDA